MWSILKSESARNVNCLGINFQLWWEFARCQQLPYYDLHFNFLISMWFNGGNLVDYHLWSKSQRKEHWAFWRYVPVASYLLCYCVIAIGWVMAAVIKSRLWLLKKDQNASQFDSTQFPLLRPLRNEGSSCNSLQLVKLLSQHCSLHAYRRSPCFMLR